MNCFQRGEGSFFSFWCVFILKSLFTSVLLFPFLSSVLSSIFSVKKAVSICTVASESVMGFLYWNGESKKFNYLDLHISISLERLITQCKLCPLPNTCMGDTQCWALMLLLHGKAAGHLLSILSFFFRGVLLLPSSSSAQSSVVCSPSTVFLFPISTGVFLPPVPLWFFLPP